MARSRKTAAAAAAPSGASAATAKSSPTLTNLLLSHFDHHQRTTGASPDADDSSPGTNTITATTCASSVLAETRAARIREEVAKYVLEREMGGVSLSDGAAQDGQQQRSVREEAIGAVLRCLDGALATVYAGTDGTKKGRRGKKKPRKSHEDDADDDENDDVEAETGIAGEWSESVHAILTLVAAVGFGTVQADPVLAHSLLDRAALLSDVASEGIRSYVCTFVGMCVEQLARVRGGGDATTSSFLGASGDDEEEKEEESTEWRTECLDKAGAILLPRLTDKTQSVRSAAIRASASFFIGNVDAQEEEDGSSSSSSSSTQEIHATLLDALLLRMAHDTSFANRCAAIRSVPIGADTVPYLLERVGDVKPKVREAALEVLSGKVDVVNDLTEEQRVDVLRFGLTSRCSATFAATAFMLCGGWMKSLKFDPIDLLRLLDPVNNESVCETATRTIIGAATDTSGGALQATLKHLSSPEVRAYKENIFEPIKAERADGEDPLDVATAFYLRIVCEFTKDSATMSASEKNEILANFMPDVPALCECVQVHLGRLVSSIRTSSDADADIEENDEDDEENREAAADFEEDESFICLQLLNLIKCADLREEGSRRHLTSILYNMLGSQETPDDLIEPCVRTLAIAHDTESQFLQTVSEIIAEIDDAESNNDTETDGLRQIRVLSILSVVLEQISGNVTSIGLLDTFSDSIVAAVTSRNNLVREAGVSCLGKYALLAQESKVVEEFKPLLFQVASSKKEKIEVRAQAMLALCDLALLFESVLGSSGSTDSSEENSDVSFAFLLSEMLTHSNNSVVVVAAEVAAKLLYAGRLNDHPSMVAHLVTIFFDKELMETNDDEEDEEDVKEIGSPIRLQQILSLFFPAFSLKSKEGRKVLMSCIKPLISIVSDKMSKKIKRRKATAWPISKMIEYVCSNVDLGDQEDANKKAEAKASENKDGNVNEEDPATEDGQNEEQEEDDVQPTSTLMASIAIADFITESSETCTTAYLRALCKIIGGADIILEDEPYENLLMLKRSMDEASMVVTDQNAIRSLETLLELLEDVEDNGEEEEEESEEEEEEEEGENDESAIDDLVGELEKAIVSEMDPALDEDENATEIMQDGKPSNTSVDEDAGRRQTLGSING